MEHALTIQSNGTKRKLLMVDEDRRDLQYYSRILELGGFEVQRVASYEEGVACLLRENFDLAVVGQEGPEFVGRPLVVQAAQADPGVPVLVLTRFVNWDCVLQAMRLGAVGCHLKSLSPSKLAELAIKAIRSLPVKAEAD